MKVVYYIRADVPEIGDRDFREWLNEQREKVKKNFNAIKVFIDVIG